MVTGMTMSIGGDPKVLSLIHPRPPIIPGNSTGISHCFTKATTELDYKKCVSATNVITIIKSMNYPKY